MSITNGEQHQFTPEHVKEAKGKLEQRNVALKLDQKVDEKRGQIFDALTP